LYLRAEDHPEFSASKGEFHITGYKEPTESDLDLDELEEEEDELKTEEDLKKESKQPKF